MRLSALSFPALSVCAALALPTACGGVGAGPPATRDTTAGATVQPPHQRTFKYTGTVQKWEVPRNVHSLTVVALGAAGNSLYGCSDLQLGGRRWNGDAR